MFEGEKNIHVLEVNYPRNFKSVDPGLIIKAAIDPFPVFLQRIMALVDPLLETVKKI